MAKTETKIAILDAAEKLFAHDGFHATSVRAITSEAKVHIASINYHFGSKEELLKAVFLRALVPINEKRLQLLDSVMSKAEAKGKPPVIKDVILAFLSPVFEALDRESTKNLSSIVDMSFATDDSSVGGVFHEIMMPMFMRFAQALSLAQPGVPIEKVTIKMHFMIGSMFHVLRFYVHAPKMKTKTLCDFKALDKQVMLDMLVSYCVSGMKAK